MGRAVALHVVRDDAGLPHIESIARLEPNPSPLRPECKASERLFRWVGVNPRPVSVLPIPAILFLQTRASEQSLQDTQGAGSGLRKLHLFCDIFQVPEADRMPASFELLNSFAIWAASDPDAKNPVFDDGSIYESVGVQTVSKYLSGIRAWHIHNGANLF